MEIKRRKRRRRKGSVRWREEINKYVIDFYDNLGKRHIETVGTNWHNANRALDRRMHEINTGIFNHSMKEVAFKNYAKSWIEGKVKVKPATKVSYSGILSNHLIPYFGDARIADIKRKNIQDFVKAKLEENSLSSKSINNILLVLHQILRDAEVEGLIVRNPYMKIERPRVEKTEKDYLRTEEIKLFLANSDARTFPLFYTAIFTGMRRGELLGVKWEDLDWAGGKIHVRRSLYKGGFQAPKSRYSRRAIDMGPRLMQVLREHRAKQNEMRLKSGKDWIDHDLVFCQNDGTPLDADNLYHRDFKRILKKAGLRHIRIHDLRHTFASILIATGHNPKYIQSQMGHASINITMDLYGHLMPEVHRGAAKRSEDFVFGHEMILEKKKSTRLAHNL